MNEYLTLGVVFNALLTIGGGALLYRKLCGPGEVRQIAPQPLAVTAAPEYMTTARCKQMHEQTEKFESTQFEAIKKELSDLRAALDRRNDQGEERARLLHERVNTVASALEHTRGQMKEHIEHGKHGG